MEKTLRSIPGFESLPASVVRSLAAISEFVSFQRGDVLFRSGEKSKYAWVLVSGKAALGGTSREGAQSSACIIRDREIFCCLPILDAGPYTVTATCESPAVVARIPAAEFRTALSRDAGAYQKLVSGFCTRMRQVECRICHQGGSAEEKVAGILLQHHRERGAEFELTRGEIAQLTGITIETAIRVMSRFRKKGVVGGGRGVVRVLKPEALTESF